MAAPVYAAESSLHSPGKNPSDVRDGSNGYGSGAPAALQFGEGFPQTPAMPTDKTVISKRPVEAPLPVLATPQKLGEALVGKTLDHYELVEFVGGGGMGAVFRANDTRLGRTVAVKVLSRDHTDEETIKRFRNEAQSAARLDHPNIARVYFVGEAEGWNYIVFEFIEGTNLRDIVERDGPLPLEDALSFTLEIAEALDHASSRDVVHRDIKPSNVLVTPDRHVKLVDMGLARLHHVESSSDDLTASGVMLGTFDYISPEQARDPRMADVRSDIYSLGCTLYYMLAGRPPFPDGTAVQKLLQHNADEPPDLRLFRADIPAPASALVSKMLAKRPAQRQQTPRELATDILALAQQLGLPALGRKASIVVTHIQAPAPLWSRVVPILGPIAALVLLLAGIDMLSRRGASGPEITSLEPKLSAAAKAEKDPQAEPAATNDQKSTATAGQDKSGNAEKLSSTETTTGQTSSEGTEAKATMADPITAATTLEPGSGQSTEPSASAPSSADATRDPFSRPTTASPNGGLDRASAALSAALPTSGGLSAEPISGSLSTGASSTAPARTITRIVVQPQGAEGEIPADHEVVRSLSRACQLCAERGIQEIELRFSGELEEKPLELARAVSIFAGAGHRPVVVFRPQDASERQMIRLTGGSRSIVQIDGVELRLELPNLPSSGWALLALYQLQELDLRNCILTVKDAAGPGGTPIQTQVAMLALQPRRLADTMKMMEDADAMLPSMSVKLSACIARGEATFLSAQDESPPLKVFWSQGLLVTTGRMFEAGGTSLKPGSFDNYEISLDHVTAVVPQGLVYQKRTPGMSSHMKLQVRCQESALGTAADAALFEFDGLSSLSEVKLRFEGENNLYPKRRYVYFLRHRPAFGTGGGDELFDISDHERWGINLYAEQIEWQTPVPSTAEMPAHAHKPEQYLLDPATSGGAGFDISLLPKPSEDSARDGSSHETGADAKTPE